MALGLVELDALAAVSAALVRHGLTNAEEAWMRFGGLSAEALERVLHALPAERTVATEAGPTPTRVMPTGAPPTPRGGVRSLHEQTRYRELSVLGTGGMGQVFECEDTRLGRRVAVKTVRPDYRGPRAEAALMLEREARLTGGLEHPNIIPIYDAGEHRILGPQYVMRLVDQPTLEEVLHDLKAGDGHTLEAYRLGRLLRYFVQVCQTVEYAHSRGVTHCDLKPGNILLGEFGEVIVVDWGLAYSAEDGVIYRGGTPGYMAPEQLDRQRKFFDARTDVFALGCILYEVLTLEPPFPYSLSAMLGPTPYKVPPLPSVLAPDRNVPPDLEEIAMAAIALEPDQRTQSAREMASALEAVIEGTKELERRRARAAELAAEGDDLAKSHFHYWTVERPRHVAEVEAIRDRVAACEPPAAKAQLWDAEDRLAIDDSVGGGFLHASIAAYEQALAQIPEHVGARKGLARLYHAELQRAQQERRDRFAQLYLEELVRLYDDGTFTRLSGSACLLDVTCEPDDAEVTLTRFEERERRLLPTSLQHLGRSPIQAFSIDPGFYTVAVQPRSGGREVRYPFYRAAGQSISLTLALAAAATLEPDEIYVPGGPMLCGGGYGASLSHGLRTVHVDAFAIAERPVSVRAYLEFVEDAFQHEPERATAYVPSRPDGVPYWTRTGPGHFEPLGISDWGALDELLALPVFGVDALSAEAFAAWRSRVTGRRYRLPRELEWEKAARGTDGRSYPWGDHFDASFCKMRDSRPSAPRPEPSGAFAADVSPYGVVDMAGGIAEWAVPTSEMLEPGGVRLMVTRGGAWCDWQLDCALASRRPAWATERAARIGFRLVRELG